MEISEEVQQAYIDAMEAKEADFEYLLADALQKTLAEIIFLKDGGEGFDSVSVETRAFYMHGADAALRGGE